MAGAIAFLVLFHSQTLPAATITVTGTGDTIAVDNVVTLREAITSINNQADVNSDLNGSGTYGSNGIDDIRFNIPGAGVRTISVTGTALPTITRPTRIDAYSQPGASANTLLNSDNAVLLVQLDGTNAGSGANGLTFGTGSGSSSARGLVINRFSGNGILIQSDHIIIGGDFIGVDPTGAVRMPNGVFPNTGDGVRIDNGNNNRIGTSFAVDRNVISGNALNGVHIIGNALTAYGNQIYGNFIGVAKDGVSSVGNRTEPAPAPGTAGGNNLYGIEISGGVFNNVGGNSAAYRNVIGFNAEGISIDNGGQLNVIQGNYIGVGADGVTPAGNLLHGIAMRSSNGFNAPLGPAQPNEPGTSFNNIGGVNPGVGNVVAFNGSGGIAVFGNPVSASGEANVANFIVSNSVFKNGRNNDTPAELGIDLTNGFIYPKDDGVTPNDSKGHDAPNDPNHFQNFPVLTAATSSGVTTNIAGTLTSAANTPYRIEFFANDPDPLGLPPEGQQLLGFIDVNTDGNGSVSFNASLNVAVATGRIITATATDGDAGNTSEFSAGILVTPQALNISTRMLVQGGNNVLIAGFIVTGSDQKTVAIRGIGPSLSQSFSGTLADPTLELHAGNSTLATNDNWQDDPAQAMQLSANGLAPSDPKESGIVATIPAQASYTAIMAGKNGGTGIGVAQIYDLNPSATSELANISSRGFVLTGNNVMIGGFILGGNGNTTRVAVRGMGPSLAQFGLNPVLADPTLELHDNNGSTLATNDNWQDDAAQADQLSANGLAPSDPNEAAIFISLPTGQFTAILAGKNGGTGIGTVEIYNLH